LLGILHIIARHCNRLQHTATHCNTLQHTTWPPIFIRAPCSCWCASLFFILYITTTHCNTLQHTATHGNTTPHMALHCNAQQHTATHCNTQHGRPPLQGPLEVPGAPDYSSFCASLQHTATQCNLLQPTATYCNKLQHTILSRTFTRAPWSSWCASSFFILCITAWNTGTNSSTETVPLSSVHVYSM